MAWAGQVAYLKEMEKPKPKTNYREKYTLGPKLGEGTYGTVYQVTDKVCVRGCGWVWV